MADVPLKKRKQMLHKKLWVNARIKELAEEGWKKGDAEPPMKNPPFPSSASTLQKPAPARN